MLNHKQLSELTGYLTANRFAILSQEKEIQLFSFITEESMMIILNDSVRFYKLAGTKWHMHYEFTGIGLLTLVHWMMLLHITGMVTLKDFSITELESEIEEMDIAKANGKSASDTLQDLFRSFAPDLPH